MKKKVLLFACALTLCLAGGAMAKGYNGHFDDMDKNGDEYVDWKEFKVYFPNGEKVVFDEIDTEKAGRFDHDQWHEFKEKRGYGHIEEGEKKDKAK